MNAQRPKGLMGDLRDWLSAPSAQQARRVLGHVVEPLGPMREGVIAVLGALWRGGWAAARRLLRLLGQLARLTWAGLRALGSRLGPALLAIWAALGPVREALSPVTQPLVERARPTVERSRAWWHAQIDFYRLRYQHNWQAQVERARDTLIAELVQARSEVRSWPSDEVARFKAWWKTRRWQKELLVCAAMLVASLWVTSPAWLLGPTKYMIGGGENPDWTGTAWAYWWTGFSIEHGLNPFDGTYDFFPVGWRPVAMYNLLDGLFGAPMMLLFGPVLGYNMFALFTVWTTGMAMIVLARAQGVSRWAALLAGVAMASSNFFGFELRDGRLSQTFLVFWLLGFTGLERLARGVGTWRLAVVTGLMVTGTFLVYWYNGLFLIIAATPIWAMEMRRWDLGRFKRLGIAAGVTILMCLPYIVSLAEHFKNLPGTQRELEAWMNYGELGRNEFGLNSAIRHSHWPGWMFVHPFLEPDDHRIAISVLVFGLLGLLFKGPARARFVGVLITGYVLTLGPYLKDYAGDPANIKLPYLFLYDHFPFFNRLWWPGRMALIVMVPLLTLAAMHLDRFAARWPRWRELIIGLGTLSVLADVDVRNAFVPIMGRAPEVYNEALYSQLKGALITTPVLGQDPSCRHHLWFQVFHKQPILTGLGAHISSHRPVGYEAYIRANGLLAALAKISENKTEASVVTPQDVNQLINDGFRWAVVDPTTFTFDYAAGYYQNFYKALYTLWGEPDVVTGYGLAWEVDPIDTSVIIPALSAAGPDEFGKAPVLPSSAGTGN